MQSIRWGATQSACRHGIQPSINHTWRICLPHRTAFDQVRNATHAAAGRANGPKQGPGKRLGAKKLGDEFVIPGHIIYRQRGTKWFPGENVGMGRDFTLYAQESGYVKYYKNPALHSKRQYIGIVFQKHHNLPSDPRAPRQRRLNMFAAPRTDILPLKPPPVGLDGKPASSTNVPPWNLQSPKQTIDKRKWSGRLKISLRDDYTMRETNWSIGQNKDRARMSHRVIRKDDRWRVWREKAKLRAEARRTAVVRKKKDTGKKKKPRTAVV